MIRLSHILLTLLLPAAAIAQGHRHGTQDQVHTSAQAVKPSPYAGMESREIKSLSKKDIDDLRRGAGWGLALAAELNGVPGPAHLLELKEEIGLSSSQISAVKEIFATMQFEAQEAGEQFIAAEAAIEAAFREGNLTPDALRALIETAAAARAELRYVHLSRHLETPPLLTAQQIVRYKELRGYGTGNPCGSVPEGHEPAMWRRHNGCTSHEESPAQ